MKAVYHQFRNEHFYFPTWNVEHLFIGTFNPHGGEQVNYYYGREKNQTWKLISEIFGAHFDPNAKDFFNTVEKYKIACVDMVDQLYAAESQIDKIIGKGYKDSEIINGAVQRQYNTAKIQKVIKENNGVNVYSTWGKGSNLKEWKKEVERLGKINSLVSPSLAARVPKGENKFDYMLNDWRQKIKHVY